jgi:hypothetical protein
MATAVEQGASPIAAAETLTRAVAIAGRRAAELGIDVGASTVIVRPQSPHGSEWRVTFGPWDLFHQRGGDRIFDVDVNGGEIVRELRGQ